MLSKGENPYIILAKPCVVEHYGSYAAVIWGYPIYAIPFAVQSLMVGEIARY